MNIIKMIIDKFFPNKEIIRQKEKLKHYELIIEQELITKKSKESEKLKEEKIALEKIEIVKSLIVNEIKNLGWSKILNYLHPDINIDCKESFEIFKIYKKIYDRNFLYKDVDSFFTVGEVILLLKLYEVKNYIN